MLVGVVADDLDGVLVCADRAVCAKTEELGLEHAFATHRDLLFCRERGEGDVVVDADGEVIFRLRQLEVVVDGGDHGRGGVGRAKTIAAADDYGSVGLTVESGLDVEVERLAIGTRLLGAVEDSDCLDGLRNSGEETLDREWAIEVYAYHADLLTLLCHVVDGLAGGLGCRTHEDDDAVGIGSAIVCEGLVLATGDFADLGHVVLDDGGNRIVVAVAALTMSEESLRVLGHTLCLRMLRRECALAELLDSLPVNERTEILHVHHLDLVVLVACAEAVEEVDERDAGLDGSEVRYGSEVHDLLDGAFAEHGEARLAACHDVAVVAEDTERVGGKGARRYVEDGREELSTDLVHIGDHEQEALRRREGCREGASLEGAVDGTCGATLGLHLLDGDGIAEEVLAALRRPLVNVLRHRGRRRDGVDGGDLREHICYVRGGFVTITSDEFLFLCHLIC